MKKAGFLDKLFGKGADNDDVPLDKDEREIQDMISGVNDLSDTTAKVIMVPRIDVVSLSIDTPMDELLAIVIECGHSRLPVFGDTIDNVVGVLYAKDLLRYLVGGEQTVKLVDIIRTPYFVPESKKLNELLREFRRRKVHIAVAVDEYGGTSGIVCLEDIIEEIVGDIQDEFDNETEDILEIGERVYLCDARTPIEDINSKLSVDLPQVDFDTLGGYVFDLFGKIPAKFEKVSDEALDFIIQEMDGHKILSVKVVAKDLDSPKDLDSQGEVDAETG